MICIELQPPGIKLAILDPNSHGIPSIYRKSLKYASMEEVSPILTHLRKLYNCRIIEKTTNYENCL